ncbi:hypothetical protein FGG08_007151 [Glutinoglossum americanum]|uniref:Uncharacterized protein n=1 Tax=Glutinoglossum americanum TaxID=1670608 RepID=A0A9P8L0C2_9PEZI|nr:hypothetical protein FGG08_007151 [Glutinoglossum americanum]
MQGITTLKSSGAEFFDATSPNKLQMDRNQTALAKGAQQFDALYDSWLKPWEDYQGGQSAIAERFQRIYLKAVQPWEKRKQEEHTQDREKPASEKARERPGVLTRGSPNYQQNANADAEQMEKGNRAAGDK